MASHRKLATSTRSQAARSGSAETPAPPGDQSGKQPQRPGRITMPYCLREIIVAAVCAVPAFSLALVGSMESGVMVGQVGVDVGLAVGQVVEHHLTGCHLVLITTTRHSLVTSNILRFVRTRVIVDVDSFFYSHHRPSWDILSLVPNATLLPPTSWQQASSQEQLTRDNLLQEVWGDSRTTCRGLILDLTSSSSITQLALRLVEMSGVWRLPETVVIAIGGRAGVRAVLLHHSLRNTVHALYLALHHASLHALNLTLHHTSHHSPPPHHASGFKKVRTQEG
nr:uncharacterized protein LOC123771532 [Procambarus clarkii]